MRNFDIVMNICTSIIVPLFLYSLVHNKRERIIYLACSLYAIIEFLYIENLSILFGLSKGLYEFFNILLCLLFFLVASKQSFLENLFLSCVPSLILMTTDLIMQFIIIQSGTVNLMGAIIENRFVIFTITNLSNILLFFLFSLAYRKFYPYIQKTMYVLLSIVVFLCALLINRFEDLLQSSPTEMTQFPVIPTFILLCITLIFIFSQIIYAQAHTETERAKLALQEETSYLNTAIREKERYFEELKHNVQLFLQLLKTNADKQEIERKAQQLENLSDAETAIPLFQSTAFSAALYNLRRNTTADIKTTYLCSKQFAIDEPDMYLILSALFERIAKQAATQSSIHITAEELETNCRMTIDYSSSSPQSEFPETIHRIMKKYGAVINIQSHQDHITITLLIPLEKDTKPMHDVL